MTSSTKILKNLSKKITTVVFVSLSLAAFATLGEGGRKSTHNSNLLSLKTNTQKYKGFSLRSGYNFRGNNILNAPKEEKFILLNTNVTYQKGNATYILPMKKKVLLDKIQFGPSLQKQ